MRALTLAIIVVLWLGRLAAAQSPDEKAAYAGAQKLFKSGKDALDVKQYTVAIAAFEGAYRLWPKPAAAYALAFAYRLQWQEDHDATKLKSAVALFQVVLAQQEDVSKHDKAKEALTVLEPALAEAEAKQAAAGAGPIAEVKVEAKTALIVSSKVKGATFRFDDEKNARPTPSVVETSPGPHRLAAIADGYYTTTQTVEALPGQSLPFELAIEPRPAVLVAYSRDDAQVAIDGVYAGRTNESIELPAGVHRVEVRAAGRHAWQQQLHFENGERVEVNASLTKTAKRKSIKWVAAAAGTLLLTGGLSAAAAWEAQGDAERFEDRRDRGEDLYPIDLAAYEDDIDTRNRWRIVSGWTLGAAGVCLLGALYLYLTDQPPPIATGIVAGGATSSMVWTW